MTAAEWGGVTADSGYAAGDAVLCDGWSRSLVTTSAAGFPQVVTILAVPALVNPGDDPADRRAPRDLLEVTTVDTYLSGADLADGDPFDSEADYDWPVAYWAPSDLRADGQPTLRALKRAARAHVAGLPTAWIDSLPKPPADLLLNGQPFAATA